MPILTPSEAAVLARRVYELREFTVSEQRERGTRFGTEGKFALDDSSQFVGKTGALRWTALSNFGYVAAGVGPYTGEVLVTTRGTDIGLDWLVNLNIGMQSGPGGWAVHSGFHETWKSFEKGLTAFLRGQHPTRIHCVGHSLGGALAALTADWATTNAVAPVSLYTFGAPRVGDAVFAGALAKRVGKENIFRVYHPADIVPMIPMLPFFHSPLVGGGLPLTTGSGALFSKDAHNMERSYIPGVAGLSWAGLAAGASAGSGSNLEMNSWLEAAQAGQAGSFMMGSATLLAMIGRALTWLVRKAAWALGSALGSGVTAGLTLLDQLSWMLGQAAKISKEVAVHVKGLMNAIFRFLGRKVGQTVDVTTAFIRWMLATLVTTLSAIARRAINTLI
jgi:triacylglycerol lipase